MPELTNIFTQGWKSDFLVHSVQILHARTKISGDVKIAESLETLAQALLQSLVLSPHVLATASAAVGNCPCAHLSIQKLVSSQMAALRWLGRDHAATLANAALRNFVAGVSTSANAASQSASWLLVSNHGVTDVETLTNLAPESALEMAVSNRGATDVATLTQSPSQTASQLLGSSHGET